VGLWPLRHVDDYMAMLESRGVFKHEDLARSRAERRAEFAAAQAAENDGPDLLQSAFQEGKQASRSITENNSEMDRAKGFGL